jgi:hypothetical protein
VLLEPIPEPVFKERAFEIKAALEDADGNRVALADHCKFKILLFTSEDTPRNLKITTSGDKIMRGTVSVFLNPGEREVVFPRVVIKEVTSHFRNSCFFGVLMPSVPYIKPLVLQNLVIKARTTKSEPGLKKKRKIE